MLAAFFARRFSHLIFSTLLLSVLTAESVGLADETDALATPEQPAETPDETPAQEPEHLWLADPMDVFDEAAEDVFHLTSMRQLGAAPGAPGGVEVDAPPSSSSLTARLFGRAGGRRSLLAGNRSRRAGQPATAIVLGSESRLRRTTDAGDLLRKSPSTLGLSGQRRSPIITDTRIRGGRIPTMLASGSYWFPARQDLDTLLSKVDSRILEDVIVIKGPYSSRYGPGHNFIDFELLSSPRYADGYESHMSSSFDYGTNGEQFYGRQTVWGGAENYGYRVGYGHKGGVDYESGNGTDIPSSYKSRDIDIALGFDIDEWNTLEVSYIRLDQTDTEVATQIFDFEFLVTDAVEATWERRNLWSDNDVFTAEAWFNQTRFDGNAQGSGKRAFMPRLTTVIGLTEGLTDAWNQSTGFSLDQTWFDGEGGSLSAGVDFRYLRQELNEFDAATSFTPQTSQNFPIPDAKQANPGLYVEAETPVGELTVKYGGRIDFVDSDAADFTPGVVSSTPSNSDGLEGGPFDRDFFLFSGFVTGEYRIDDIWTLNGGLGNSMRAPTMTEMYARGPFVSIMPQFAGTSLFGNPGLRREKRYQVDVGLHVDDGCCFRAGANGFHAWIDDYITLDNVANIRDPNNGEVLIPNYQFTNTDLATLAGFEIYMEHDATEWLTTFANANYTEGRDQTRFETQSPIALNDFGQGSRAASAAQDEPLWGIAPLEARVGARLQDPGDCWGLEFAARIVDAQDRVATALFEQPTAGYTTYDVRGYIRPTDNILFVAGIENLTDKQYRTHFDPRHLGQVFQPGINFVFGTEVTY